VGDVILARMEVPAATTCSVVGERRLPRAYRCRCAGLDLAPATAVHPPACKPCPRALPRTDPTFHHRLILDETGRKLSKSRGSESLRARRLAGESAEALIAGLELPPI
jgi:glutamyl-Q tRNA(Asp) synthetase